MDKIIGHKYLAGIHLNDPNDPITMAAMCTRAWAWGSVGLETLKIDHEQTKMPKILETQMDDPKAEIRVEEIALLK